MSDVIHSAVVALGVDASGMDAGIAKGVTGFDKLAVAGERAGQRASAGINQIGAGSEAAAAKVEASTGKIGRSIATLGQQAGDSGKAASDSIGKIGDGGNAAAAKVDAATKNMIGSIQRTTATLEAGSKSSAKYYETLANQRGINVNSLKPYLDQLDAVKVKQELASKALLAADPAMKQIGMSAAATANAMRNVPAQFTDIVTSLQGGQKPLTVLIQQGGQLKDMFGGIGPAAKALGGYVAGLINPFTAAAAAAAGLAFAYHAGAAESQAYQKALILSGNSAGTTANQLSEMARNISAVSGTTGAAAEALALMAGSGKVAGENLQGFTAVALSMEKQVGIAVSDTVKQFAELATSPVSASEKLNDQIHYLTASVYDQIKALDEQGKSQEAGELAQKAYADAMAERTKQIQNNIGTVERAYKASISTIKGWWDAILGVGRSDPASQIAAIQAKIANIDMQGQGSTNPAFAARRAEAKSSLQAELGLLQSQVKATEGLAADSAKIAKSTEARVAWSKLADQYQSKQAKQSDEIAKAEEKGLADGRSRAEIEKIIAGIRDKYKEKGSGRMSAENKELADQAKLLAQLSGLTGTFSKDWDHLSKSYASGAISLELLTKAQSTLLEKQPAIRAASEAAAKLAEEEAKYYADLAKSRFDASSTLIKSADAEAEKNEMLAQTFGMTQSAIEQLEIARLEEQLTQAKSIAADTAETIGLEMLIDAKKRSAAALGSIESKEIAKKANEEMAADWKKTVDTYEDLFRKGFADMVNGGKGTWKSFTTSLVTTFKTTVADQIYKMFAQKFVINMVGNILGVSGGAAGAASAASGGTDILGAASNGKAAYDLYNGGIGNSYSNFAYSEAGQKLGLSTVGYDTSEGIATLTKTSGNDLIGSTGGQIVSTVGGAYSAYSAGEKYGALGGVAAGAGTVALGGAAVGAVAGTGALAGAGAALTALGPIGWAALVGAAILGGMQDGPEENTVLKFGSNNAAGNTSNNQRGPEGNTGSYIDGSSSGAFGTFGVVETLWMDARQQIVQDFIKNTTLTDNALAKLLSQSEVDSVTKAVTDKTSTAYTGPEGSNPNGTGQLDQAFKDRMLTIFDSVESGLSNVITGFTGGAAQLASEAQALLTVRKNIDSYTELFGQDVSLQLLATSFAGLKVEGESTATVISRMAKTFSETSAVATMLGQDGSAAFGAIGLASSEARLKLVELSGGLEAFSAKAISYAQNYLTPEEQLAPKVTAVDKALADLGYTGIKTRDQFRALVEGLDLSSQAGATTYAALMNLSPAFAEITQATKSVADAAMKALESAVSKQRDIVTTAYNLTSQSIQTGIDNVSASLSKFQGLADALKSTLNEIRPMSRVEAQGYFGAQLDIAKAGGPVPTAADIGPALEALKKPSEDLFSTFLDWQRDQQMTANVIEEAAKLAGEQVSYEEQALKALQSQSDQLRRTYEDEMMRLDDILVSAQAQIDGLDTVNSSVLSVAEAIANLQDMLNPNSAKKKEAEASAMLGNGNDPTHTRGGIEEWSKSPTGMYYQSSGGAKYTASDNLIRAPGSAVGYTPDEVRKFIDDGLAGGDIASLAKTILSKGGSAESVDLLLSLPPGTSEEFLRGKIPGFAGGGDFGGGLRMVGENGPELEVTGPSRIFNASQTRQMMQGGDNAQLSEAVDRLTAIVAQQQAALESIERATTKTANTLVTVTRGGEAMQTEVAA